MTQSILDIDLRRDERTLCMRWKERSAAAREEGVPDPSSTRVYFVGASGGTMEPLDDLRSGLVWLRDALSADAFARALVGQEAQLGSMACATNDAGLLVTRALDRDRCLAAFRLPVAADDMFPRWTSSSRLHCFGELSRIWDMGGVLSELEIDPCTGAVVVLHRWAIDAY